MHETALPSGGVQGCGLALGEELGLEEGEAEGEIDVLTLIAPAHGAATSATPAAK